MSSVAQVIKVNVPGETEAKNVAEYRNLSSDQCKLGEEQVKGTDTRTWEKAEDKDGYAYAPISAAFYSRNKSRLH